MCMKVIRIHQKTQVELFLKVASSCSVRMMFDMFILLALFKGSMPFIIRSLVASMLGRAFVMK